jgi:hypothetical protein
MKSALQEFIEWGDEMMLKYPMKELGFGQAIDKAEELLKKRRGGFDAILEWRYSVYRSRESKF